MAKYSDEYRAAAIALLTAEGYPADGRALRRVHGQLALPRPNIRTLRYWFNREHRPAPDKVIAAKKEDLSALFEEAATKYVKHALRTDVLENESGKNALTGAAIAVDKMRLLRDLPTEIIAVLPIITETIAALQAIGEDPEVVFNKLAAAARERQHVDS